ncbi:MAG TPA: hypothetical protein VM053_05205 [Gemmatimonadaceae bacterium]|nr:hypothetical protein [Gemmatimonadaceae bacterium]
MAKAPDISPKDDLDGPGDRRDPGGERSHDRRRGGWSDFRRAYPGFVFTLLLGLAVIVALDVYLVVKRRAYESEVARLRSSMSETERAKTDAIVAQEQNKTRIALELAKRQAKIEKSLHLSVAVDSGKIYLERDGAVLREMAAMFGPEAKVSNGTDSIPVVVPRGQRSVTKISDDGIVLEGGTVMAPSDANPLASDTNPIPPGGVRISRADLKAILPNLSPGMRVYFY